MSYAKVRTVGFDYKGATKNKLNFKKEERNPEVTLYNNLKKNDKVLPLITLTGFSPRIMTYKEWVSFRYYL